MLQIMLTCPPPTFDLCIILHSRAQILKCRNKKKNALLFLPSHSFYFFSSCFFFFMIHFMCSSHTCTLWSIDKSCQCYQIFPPTCTPAHKLCYFSLFKLMEDTLMREATGWVFFTQEQQTFFLSE